jgi:hypothetical protein
LCTFQSAAWHSLEQYLHTGHHKSSITEQVNTTLNSQPQPSSTSSVLSIVVIGQELDKLHRMCTQKDAALGPFSKL